MKLTATVFNLPESIEKYGFITVRAVDGDLWFYGAWYATQEADAHAEARAIGGLVLKVEWCYD